MDDDTLSGLLREASAEVNRAQARRMAIAGEWDRRQAWTADGAYNGRCWLAANCSLSRREAHTVLHTAEVVASAPLVAAAVEAGSLPVAKVEVLASVVTVRTAAAFVRDQEVLLEAVARLSVDETRKAARWWQRLADVEGAEPVERPAGLRWSVAGDGTTHVAGTLDVEGGAIVRSMLESIADQLWRAERDPDQVEARPVGQNERLRGQALIEMARRSGAADPARTGARPLVTVLVDLDTLEGGAGHPAQVEGGGLVTAEAARRLACDADISRLLTDPDGALLQLAAPPAPPPATSGGPCASATAGALARMRPAPRLVPGPPHRLVAARRRHRPGEPDPVVLAPPPSHPRRRLAPRTAR